MLYCEVAMSSDEARYLQATDELNIDLTNSTLSSELKYQILLLIGEYRDIFSKNLAKVVGTDKYSHHIDMGNVKPIFIIQTQLCCKKHY